MKAAFKNLLAATVGAAALSLTLGSRPAQTASLAYYNFTVDITNSFCAIGSSISLNSNCDGGVYVGAGEKFTGKVTYDDSNLTKTGLERLDPRSTGTIYVGENSRLAPGGLQVQFSFLDKVYTEKDDFLYYDPSTGISGFPRLTFLDGNLLGLDFLVDPVVNMPGSQFVPGSIGFQIFQDQFLVGSQVTLDSNSNIVDFGISGTPVGTVAPTAAVPEPSGIAGVLLVGGFVGLKLWKKRNHDRVGLPLDQPIEPATHTLMDTLK